MNEPKINFAIYSIFISSSQSNAIVAPKEKRKPQTCCFCKNHGISILKKDHKNSCKFRECDCDLCQGTKNRQLFSAREKQKHYILSKKIQLESKIQGRQRNEQKCRKCLNHGSVQSMRDHKKKCPFIECNCEGCKNTLSRRKHVTNEAKTKRQMEKNNQYETKAEEIDVEEVFGISLTYSPSHSTLTDMKVDFLSPRSHDTGYNSSSPPHYPCETGYDMPITEELPRIDFILSNNENLQNNSFTYTQINYYVDNVYSYNQALLIDSQNFTTFPDLKDIILLK